MTFNQADVIEKIKELAVKHRLNVSLYMNGDTVDISGILNTLSLIGALSPIHQETSRMIN